MSETTETAAQLAGKLVYPDRCGKVFTLIRTCAAKGLYIYAPAFVFLRLFVVQ